MKGKNISKEVRKILDEADREELLVFAKRLNIPGRRSKTKKQLKEQILKEKPEDIEKTIGVSKETKKSISQYLWFVPIVGVLIMIYFQFNPVYVPQIPDEVQISFEATLRIERDSALNFYRSQLIEYAKDPFARNEVSMATISSKYGSGFVIPTFLLNKDRRLGHTLNRLFGIEVDFKENDKNLLSISGNYNDSWSIEKLTIDGSGKIEPNSLNLCYFPITDVFTLSGILNGSLNKNPDFNDLLQLEDAEISGRLGSLRMSPNYSLILESINLSTKDGLSLKLTEIQNSENKYKVLNKNIKWE